MGRKKIPDDAESNSHLKRNQSLPNMTNEEAQLSDTEHTTVVDIATTEQVETEDELDMDFPDYLEDLKNDIMQNVLALSSLRVINRDIDSTENICR